MKVEEIANLRAEIAELESVLKGCERRADQWRLIANEMGYEPKAHAHEPLPDWLRERIARYRREAAATALTDQAGRIERLVEALGFLEQMATQVNHLGATTGPQWPRLARALVKARSALQSEDGR